MRKNDSESQDLIFSPPWPEESELWEDDGRLTQNHHPIHQTEIQPKCERRIATAFYNDEKSDISSYGFASQFVMNMFTAIPPSERCEGRPRKHVFRFEGWRMQASHSHASHGSDPSRTVPAFLRQAEIPSASFQVKISTRPSTDSTVAGRHTVPAFFVTRGWKHPSLKWRAHRLHRPEGWYCTVLYSSIGSSMKRLPSRKIHG